MEGDTYAKRDLTKVREAHQKSPGQHAAALEEKIEQTELVHHLGQVRGICGHSQELGSATDKDPRDGTRWCDQVWPVEKGPAIPFFQCIPPQRSPGSEEEAKTVAP